LWRLAPSRFSALYPLRIFYHPPTLEENGKASFSLKNEAEREVLAQKNVKSRNKFLNRFEISSAKGPLRGHFVEGIGRNGGVFTHYSAPSRVKIFQ
jgi:hypothetical protein